MHSCCGKWGHAIMMLILGLVLIVNQLYLNYDIWVVIGVLIIIKAIVFIVMPGHDCCESKPKRR